jgi:hypothetical protein
VNFNWVCKAIGGPVEVIITDMLGHKVLQKDYAEVQGNNALSISVSPFAPACTIIRSMPLAACNGEHLSKIKLIKKEQLSLYKDSRSFFIL